MKVEMIVRVTEESPNDTRSPRRRSYANACALPEEQLQTASCAALPLHDPSSDELSAWSGSPVKRLFDCACVLAALPLAVPVLSIVAAAVRITSAGPVFFRQQRVGARGRLFTIFKFRTMIYDSKAAYHAVTTDGNQPFTAIGPFLRRTKLDELPQILNVLRGDMSLVGPRPKMPEHVTGGFSCRPGITGAATLVFAREETLLDSVPEHELESFYHGVVLPAKCQLDAEYMSRATLLSDLKLIAKSMLRRWHDSLAMRSLLIERSRSNSNLPEGFEPDRDADWIGVGPIRIASVSARVGFRRWLDDSP